MSKVCVIGVNTKSDRDQGRRRFPVFPVFFGPDFPFPVFLGQANLTADEKQVEFPKIILKL
jgi:hypothetical protein